MCALTILIHGALDKYIEGAKRKCTDGYQHAAQAANNVPHGVARTIVSNNKTVVQHGKV